jgi:hypothetical protein
MANLFGGIEKAKAAGRAAAGNMAAILVAAAFAAVGFGFLVAAAYIALAAEFGSLMASILIGAVFLALAALVIAIRFAGAERTPPPQAADLPPPSGVDPLAQMVFEIAYGFARSALARRAESRRSDDRRRG